MALSDIECDWMRIMSHHHESSDRYRWLSCSIVRRMLAGLAVAGIVSAGCSSNGQPPVEDGGVPDEAGVPVVTVVEEIPEAPDDEQAAAERMLTDAMADGLMDAEEFEEFALETVACVRRAGFEADLDYFNAENRTAGFSVRPVDQTGTGSGEDPSELAYRSCATTFFDMAHNAFDETNPRSEEEFQLQQQQREEAVLDCAREAGFEFETLEDYIDGTGNMPAEVAVACTAAYNE